MDDFQTSRTLEVGLTTISMPHSQKRRDRHTVDDHDLLRSLFLVEAVQNDIHGFPKYNPIRTNLLRRPDV